jgi:hypothetical protein
MAKKAARKSSEATPTGQFSLVALHSEFTRVKARLKDAPKTPKMRKLAEDLDCAITMMGCDSGMNRNY